MKLSAILFFSLLFFHCFSQTQKLSTNQEKIKNLIENYFDLDRENIHVQFNKTIYVNDEYIGFKGYVFRQKNNTPNPYTTNVRLVIYDDQEQIIQKQLLYTNNGIFVGGIHLNEKFKSGKYYFHFYTNWMNNFKEDDSFIQPIEIINKNEPYNFKSDEPVWETAKLTFFPEGGNIINEISNTVGINLVDCNKKGIELKNAIIVDSKLNEICRFNINKMGNGVFYFIPDINETYTLKIKTEKLTISQNLPATKETGFAISYNNNLPNDLIAIAVKTNEKGLKLTQNKKFTLLIYQGVNSIQKEISFANNELEQLIIFNKKYLSNGVNSIRLLDENLSEISERLIYKYASEKINTRIEAKVSANDSIMLSGKIEAKNAALSISVLPEKNVCVDLKNSILGTFYLNAYLENPVIDNYNYYNPENKNRKQEMELLMLNQNNSKYHWENIKSNPPKINYKFNKGVTIEGKVERKIGASSKCKISLLSLKDSVFEDTNVDANGNFRFDNFFAKDSTVFILQMVNEKNNPIYTKMDVKVIPNENVFMSPLKFNKSSCPIVKNLDNQFYFSNQNTANKAIKLESVTIKNNYKKVVFEHENEMSLNANAYKIEDNDFGSVLDFIGRNGFRTGIDPEDNEVYIRNSRGGFSNLPPAVYIDNIIISDFNLLYSQNLNEVDEIYIDKTGASDSSPGTDGTIKIFLKKGIKNDYYRAKHTSLIVTKGFAQNIEFKNSEFEKQDEFFYFGTLNWSPNITIKDNSNYEIRFPRGSQKEIQVLIEGFSTDGQLISENQRIQVQEN